MFAGSNTSTIMGSVPNEKAGVASGMMTVMRQTEATTSMAIAMLTVSLTMGPSDGISSDNYGAFVDAMHLAFSICLTMYLFGIAASKLKGRTLADNSSDQFD